MLMINDRNTVLNGCLREDMIKLLGKRPFSRTDDMDKWLDENRGENSAPPPLERVEDLSDEPMPAPVAAVKQITWDDIYRTR